jgi:hypothetical protein
MPIHSDLRSIGNTDSQLLYIQVENEINALLAGQLNFDDIKELEEELAQISGTAVQEDVSTGSEKLSFPETPSMPVLPLAPTSPIIVAEKSVPGQLRPNAA